MNLKKLICGKINILINLKNDLLNPTDLIMRNDNLIMEIKKGLLRDLLGV